VSCCVSCCVVGVVDVILTSSSSMSSSRRSRLFTYGACFCAIRSNKNYAGCVASIEYPLPRLVCKIFCLGDDLRMMDFGHYGAMNMNDE